MGRKEQEEHFDEEDTGHGTDVVENSKPEDLRILEALLFASDELMNAARLKAILPGQPDARKIRTMVEKINVQLQKERHPFEIVEIGGGYQFRTIAFYHPWVRQIFKEKAVKKLSIQALECLAIIAYKQPLSKAEIEAIRGVVSDGAMKTLLEKRLVTIAGRSEKPGRPLLYGTTNVFLTYFGLNKIEDLPRIEEFEALAREKMDELSLEELSAPDVLEEEAAPDGEPGETNHPSEESSLFEVEVAPVDEALPAAELPVATPAHPATDTPVPDDAAHLLENDDLADEVEFAQSDDVTVLDLDIAAVAEGEEAFEVSLASVNDSKKEDVRKEHDKGGIEDETVFYTPNKTSAAAEVPEKKSQVASPEATVVFDRKEVVGIKEAAEAVSSGKKTFEKPLQDVSEMDDGATVFDVNGDAAVKSQDGDVTFEVGEAPAPIARFSENDIEQFGGAMMETKMIHPEKLHRKKKKQSDSTGSDKSDTESTAK